MKRYSTLLSAVLLIPLILPACKAEIDSLEPTKPDVVVLGSELEGMYLAKAAKEGGLDVLVLDPRDEPGGQLIQGEMVFLDEPQQDGGDTLLQGEVKKLFDAYKKGQIRKKDDFQRYYQKLVQGIPMESGIVLTHLDIDNSAPKRITSLTYQLKNGQTKKVTPRYVVENTDHAYLVSRLGLPRIPGIESVYGGEKDYMAATFMMKFKRVNWKAFQDGVQGLPQGERYQTFGDESTVTQTFTWGFGKVGARFKPSDEQLFLRGLNIINQNDGEAAINALLVYGVDPSDPTSIKNAVEKGKKEAPSILAHLRKELPGWEKAELNGSPSYLYIRDYDRYETEVVLQASDLMRGRMYWDNVSIAGYPIDLQGTKANHWGFRKGVPDKYGIPLRAFIPKGYGNVLTAGKNVGATGAAYGSARIQPNTALAGEAIGLILASIKDKYELTDINEERMAELHRMLAAKGIVLTGPDGKDKLGDMSPSDLQQFNFGKMVK